MVPPEARPSAPATDFRSALLDAVHHRPWGESRFVRLVESEQPAEAALRLFSFRLYTGVVALPRYLAGICSITPDPDVRVALLDSVLEQEGIVTGPPEGPLRCDPAARHSALAARFAHACGVSDDELMRATLTPPTSWLDEALGDGLWLSSMAFLLAGVEGNARAMFTRLLPALVRRGFRKQDLAFFERQIAADRTHGGAGLSLIEGSVRSDTQRASLVEAARRGALEWWIWCETCLRPAPV